jgi:hypothetical protein
MTPRSEVGEERVKAFRINGVGIKNCPKFAKRHLWTAPN